MRWARAVVAVLALAGCGHGDAVDSPEAAEAGPRAAPQEKKQLRKRKRKLAMRAETQPSPIGPTEPLGFFDAHVHLNDVDMARLVMNESGISKAIVFWGGDSTNDSLLAAVEQHPDMFVPFASFSPERDAYREFWDANDPALLDELDVALATGRFAGIGELSVTHFASHGFPEITYGPLHPMTVGMLELARKHAVPVTMHCEATAAAGLAALLGQFPDVTVIWAHGGYTTHEVAEAMIDAHSNLVYELSARTWRNHPRSSEYTIYATDQDVDSDWLLLIEARPTRFVVGTDAALHNPERARAKVGGVQRLLEQLTPRTRALVARDNLTRVLKGPGPAPTLEH